jgi:hypothetical protein
MSLQGKFLNNRLSNARIGVVFEWGCKEKLELFLLGPILRWIEVHRLEIIIHMGRRDDKAEACAVRIFIVPYDVTKGLYIREAEGLAKEINKGAHFLSGLKSREYRAFNRIGGLNPG